MPYLAESLALEILAPIKIIIFSTLLGERGSVSLILGINQYILYWLMAVVLAFWFHVLRKIMCHQTNLYLANVFPKEHLPLPCSNVKLSGDSHFSWTSCVTDLADRKVLVAARVIALLPLCVNVNEWVLVSCCFCCSAPLYGRTCLDGYLTKKLWIFPLPNVHIGDYSTTFKVC